MRPVRLQRLPLLALVPGLLLFACQGDDEKIAGFVESGAAYVEEGALEEAVIEYRNVLQIDPNHAAAHYALAKAYIDLKQGREAYWELSESVRLDPSNVEARLSLGGIALLAGDVELALEQAEHVIDIDPGRGNAHVLNGQALERLKRVEEAERSYRLAIEADPAEGAYLLVAAGYYARRGNSDEAEVLLHKLTQVSPDFLSFSALARHLAADKSRRDDATAAFERAIALADEKQRTVGDQNLASYWLATGRADDAVVLLEEGIERAPAESDGKLDLIYLLARVKRAQGREAEADQLVESGTAAQPNDVKPHLVLSAYRGRKGDLEGALAAAEAALAVDPDSKRAQLRKAELLIDLGYRTKDPPRLEEGRAIVDALLEEKPSNPDALFVRGKLRLAEGESAAAAKALRAALDSRPKWAQAHFVLGSALMLLGEKAAARVEIARSVELDSELIEARRMLAKLHAALGEHEYAVEEGKLYLAARPDHRKTRILVAQSLLRLGRPEEAQAELDLIPETVSDADVLFARARLSLSWGETEEARAFLIRAAEAAPHHPEILGTLLSIDRGTQRSAETKALVDAALAARPEDSELARLSGAMALIDRDLDGAERGLRRAIELDPNNMAAYRQLASLYQVTGRLDETLVIYKQALEQQPDNAQLHHFVGVLYEISGRPDDAMVSYEKAIELDDTLGQPQNNLAYLLAESGRDLDRALEFAQDAKRLMPENANASDTLGWVLLKRGVSSAAVGYLKEAEALMEPGSQNLGIVRHHLAQAYEASGQEQDAIETLERALSDLEQQLAASRGRPRQPEEPAWSGPARDMLKRLKPAG